VTLHPLSQAGVFTYSSRGKWVCLPLLWIFPPTTTFTRFPTPGCWACATATAFSGQLVYYSSVRDFPPPPLWHSECSALFATCLFCYCLYSVSLFSLGGGRSVQGAMLIWPRIDCGSTVCCLAHLVVHVISSGLGTGVWQHRSPPGFSI
jgi:hypothetical protein